MTAIMNADNFYCVATDASSEAAVRFPTPLDTSASGYEIALVYCRFEASTKKTDLWLKATSTAVVKGVAQQTTQKIIFEDVPNIPSEYLLPFIARKIASEWGSNMSEGTLVKLYDTEEYPGWSLKIQKTTFVEFSETLADILGQNTVIKNEVSAVVEYPVKPRETLFKDKIYYLTCDQIRPNCVTQDGGVAKLLDVIHSDGQMVRHWNQERQYHRLDDDILLSQLHLKLINRDGTMETDSPDLYLLLHIRKHGAYNQGKLA
jgi:hypothetical protein